MWKKRFPPKWSTNPSDCFYIAVITSPPCCLNDKCPASRGNSGNSQIVTLVRSCQKCYIYPKRTKWSFCQGRYMNAVMLSCLWNRWQWLIDWLCVCVCVTCSDSQMIQRRIVLRNLAAFDRSDHQRVFTAARRWPHPAVQEKRFIYSHFLFI